MSARLREQFNALAHRLTGPFPVQLHHSPYSALRSEGDKQASAKKKVISSPPTGGVHCGPLRPLLDGMALHRRDLELLICRHVLGVNEQCTQTASLAGVILCRDGPLRQYTSPLHLL